MKIFKKILATLLAVCTIMPFAACGKGGDTSSSNGGDTSSGDSTTSAVTPSTNPYADGKTYKVTVYRARSSGMTDGDRDDEVKAAIEQAFYEDTGVKMDLDLQLYTNTQIKDIVPLSIANKNKNIDGIFHYLSEDSGSAITLYAKSNKSTIDLDPVLAKYGQNIIAKIKENDTDNIAERSGYFTDGEEYYRTALASFAKEGGYGILMRKDYMESVKTITGLDPEDYDITNDGYKSMTVSEFEKVMKAIKENVADVNMPVTGAPWDLQRVVATAYGVNAMSGFGFNANGKLVPAQFTQGWDQYVDLMYRWSSTGIWEKESDTTSDDQRQSNFISGAVAAYMAYPTAEQLIDLSRRVYASNDNAELMVIAPFASEDANGNSLMENGKQVVNGNMKSYRSFYGGIVPYNSKNYEVLIQYLDWMYSSAENYELCQYGVKGVDWVDGDDFTYGGKTYKTWKYPDDKAEEYLSKPPYTGKYMLLENINVSNRINGHYDNIEQTWYASLYFEFPQYANTELEGIWQPKPTRIVSSQASNMDGDYVNNIRAYAWAGIKNNNKTPVEVLTTHINTYKSSTYLTFVNEQYEASKAYFAQKFGW